MFLAYDVYAIIKQFMVLKMMRTTNKIKYPSASLNYHDKYRVSITEEQLNSISTIAFTTHRNWFAEKIHRASQFCLIPSRKSVQLIASSFQSRPGADKEEGSVSGSRPIRMLIGFVGVISFIASAAVTILTSPIHLAALIGHRSRPVINYINAKKGQARNASIQALPAMTENKPLHVRTHNLGFVHEAMNIIGDLRPVCERAHEISNAILNDTNQPDVICFQEAFHEDGSRILCDKLKNQYPYIISNVLPNASGFNSGAMIVSKYPILGVKFHCLEHNLGPERLAPKGILRASIGTQKGLVNIYSVHTQALLGKDRANARLKQLQQMKRVMKKDFFKRGAHQQILMGDLNTSAITAWGESNITANNPELEVQEELLNEFDDLYLRDHQPLLGSRVHGNPKFLDSDNASMGLIGNHALPEPTGSWYHGPFATATTYLASSVLKHNEKDQRKHKYQTTPAITPEQPPSWGTVKWRQNQPANTARFDYVLFPRHKDIKNQPIKSPLDGYAEIRRIVVPKDAQSAPSDHLPVDALIWKRP